MLVWITIKVFEALFGTHLGSSAIGFLQGVSFTELLIEITALLALTLTMVAAFVSSKWEK
jgi:hypothetical protein